MPLTIHKMADDWEMPTPVCGANMRGNSDLTTFNHMVTCGRCRNNKAVSSPTTTTDLKYMSGVMIRLVDKCDRTAFRHKHITINAPPPAVSGSVLSSCWSISGDLLSVWMNDVGTPYEN